MDLTLKTREGYFNYRVAGVIIKDDKILAQRNTKTNEYYLPGGRVVFGETSEEALLREIEEELKIDITDYKPLCLMNVSLFIVKVLFTKSVCIILLIFLKLILIILSLNLNCKRKAG